ncbi:MAG: DUF4358 domain-containing protein [Sporanaerobacter sp.]|uniref:DUF4358 domain-containing protein n=1 Tax=Sporanaerobacter sp. TaxID=2010183 RepID=UPI003A0FEDCD
MKNLNKGILATTGIIIIIFILLTGCSSDNKAEKEPSIDEIEKNISEAVDLSNMKKVDGDKLEKLYDIHSDELEGFLLYTADTNIKADEMLILKVSDEKDISDIQDKISNRIEEQSNSFKDYLPDEYYLIEKHVLKSNGQYILFVISEDAEKIESIFDESFK